MNSDDTHKCSVPACQRQIRLHHDFCFPHFCRLDAATQADLGRWSRRADMQPGNRVVQAKYERMVKDAIAVIEAAEREIRERVKV